MGNKYQAPINTCCFKPFLSFQSKYEANWMWNICLHFFFKHRIVRHWAHQVRMYPIVGIFGKVVGLVLVVYLNPECKCVKESSFTRILSVFVSQVRPWITCLPWLQVSQKVNTTTGSLVSCQIRTIACCACAGNARHIFPATDFKGNR